MNIKTKTPEDKAMEQAEKVISLREKYNPHHHMVRLLREVVQFLFLVWIFSGTENEFVRAILVGAMIWVLFL